MLPYILHYMKISHSQMQMENLSKINKANPSSNELSANDSTTIASKKVSITKKILENLDLDEDIDYLEYFVYNSYWTLRKCSSKLIDKIASNHSLLTYSNLRPFLEVDLQSSDWIKKYSYLIYFYIYLILEKDQSLLLELLVLVATSISNHI